MKRHLVQLVIVLLVLLVLALTFMASASAQSLPTLTARQVDIIQTLYERERALAEGSEDDRRRLTIKIIQQFVCEFPADGFTGKSQSAAHPLSKDSIARHYGGRLYAWDWQDGKTRRPQVRAGMPPSFDITDQLSIPFACVDHLAVVPPESTPPPPLPPSSDIGPRLDVLQSTLYNEIHATRVAVDEMRASLEEHRKVSRSLYDRALGFFRDPRTITMLGGIVAGRWLIPDGK